MNFQMETKRSGEFKMIRSILFRKHYLVICYSHCSKQLSNLFATNISFLRAPKNPIRPRSLSIQQQDYKKIVSSNLSFGTVQATIELSEAIHLTVICSFWQYRNLETSSHKAQSVFWYADTDGIPCTLQPSGAIRAHLQTHQKDPRLFDHRVQLQR